MYFCFLNCTSTLQGNHSVKYRRFAMDFSLPNFAILFLYLNAGRENCKEETEGAGLPTKQAEIKINEKLKEVELRCHGPLLTVPFAALCTTDQCYAGSRHTLILACCSART
jgi:hypothetical protein